MNLALVRNHPVVETLREQCTAAFAPPDADVPNEDVSLLSRAGWIVIGLFFGVFGLWSIAAPISGAVVAEGVIKVEGNRKSVQHPDGGIVRELKVREGDKVASGQVLIVLDDTQARAEFEILAQQYALLRMTEQRLKAEFTRAPLDFPDSLADQRGDRAIAALWTGQVDQFESRRTALDGQRKIIDEKIGQLRAQISGAEAQNAGLASQHESITKERESLTPLVERGLVARTRTLQLERTASGLQGQMGEIAANIAKSRQAISEQMQQAIQLDNDRSSQIAQDMRETQGKLVDVMPKLANARAVLERTSIRTPYSGNVVALTAFSVGGVIGRGEKVMDIVPDREALIVEAQVPVQEISEVHPAMPAELRLIAYQQRTTPTVKGEVVQVSADRLTDPHSGKPYYVAQLRIDQDDLKRLPDVQLYPGMPVTVMMTTAERSAFRYLVGPLAMSFDRAFRER